MFIIQGAFALSSCIVMSTGGTEKIVTNISIQNYVSLRVYNSTVSTDICEEGVYSISLQLIPSLLSTELQNIHDYFDYNLSDNNISLINGENKRVLLTLIPKVSGDYNIKVTVGRQASGNSSSTTSIVSTTSAKIEVIVDGNEQLTNTSIVPMWTQVKVCSNGRIVDINANCIDNNVVFFDGNNDVNLISPNNIQTSTGSGFGPIFIIVIIFILVGATIFIVFKGNK
jgi:hypothetical protein